MLSIEVGEDTILVLKASERGLRWRWRGGLRCGTERPREAARDTQPRLHGPSPQRGDAVTERQGAAIPGLSGLRMKPHLSCACFKALLRAPRWSMLCQPRIRAAQVPFAPQSREYFTGRNQCRRRPTRALREDYVATPI